MTNQQYKYVSVYNFIDRYNKFLYKLLKDRGKIENISHSKMPLYADHVNFIKSMPYLYWNVITTSRGKSIASVYVTNEREIGVHISKEYKGTTVEQFIIYTVIRDYAHLNVKMNINPKNKSRINQVKKAGFKLIQVTYGVNQNK